MSDKKFAFGWEHLVGLPEWEFWLCTSCKRWSWAREDGLAGIAEFKRRHEMCCGLRLSQFPVPGRSVWFGQGFRPEFTPLEALALAGR